MKIQIRGGSIAAGKGVNKNYIDILRERLSPYNIDVISTAHLNDNSFDGIWYYFKEIDIHHPDMLILHFGIDDIYAPVYRSEFKENIVQIVRLARRNFNTTILLMTSQPFDSDYEMTSANIYYRALREISLDMNCEYVPVHLYWANYLYENSLKHADFIQDDDRYPNEKGHEIFADCLMKYIEKLFNLPSKS
ncbi:MAG: SGNH/GDSL hydrolase family protein [Spirochaetes bacterium]|nr:SGNH/GDSL hydrolase family protein [Spirochaetota bacterium]